MYLYPDSTEQDCVGAVSLPSYSINPCLHDGNINKKYAFKVRPQFALIILIIRFCVHLNMHHILVG